MEPRGPTHRSAPPPATPPPPGPARTPTLPPVAAPPRGLGAQPAPAAQAEFSPDQAIAEQLRGLERWLANNIQDSRRNAVRFWIMKGLAFFTGAAATACHALGYPRPVVVLGIASALFIAIDAGWHGGLLHTTHRRAMDELRQLHSMVKLRWDKVRLSSPDPRAATRVSEALQILNEVHAKRDELGRYLATADVSGSDAPPAK